MSADAITAAFLDDASITALVGDRVAHGQLSQNDALPGIVYTIVSDVPEPWVNTADQYPYRARVQINPLAATIGEVRSIHAAVKALMNFQYGVTQASKTVLACRLMSFGPVDQDTDSGIWTRPADYELLYFP